MFGPHFITFIMCLKFVSFSVSGHLNFIRKIPEFVKLVADCSQMIFCLVMNFLNKQNKFEASIIFKGRIRFWALSLMTQMKNQTHCSAQSPLKWSFSGDEFLPNLHSDTGKLCNLVCFFTLLIENQWFDSLLCALNAF